MTTATHPALRTPLCDLLGITYPICQAGMGYVARAALAAAVSEAGGLGVIAILAREQGDIDNGNAPCGHSAGLIRDIRPAGAVVRSLVEEAEAVLDRLAPSR